MGKLRGDVYVQRPVARPITEKRAMLPDPQDYFYFSPHEGELAEEVWNKAESIPNRSLSWPHNVMSRMPGFHIPSMRRLLYARDFITVERTYGDVDAYTKGKYTASEVANVEHFYTAALLAVLGGMSFAIAGSSAWDGLISPISKLATPSRGVLSRMANDLKQLTFYDMEGAAFGCTCNPSIVMNPLQALMASQYVLQALEKKLFG